MFIVCLPVLRSRVALFFERAEQGIFATLGTLNGRHGRIQAIQPDRIYFACSGRGGPLKAGRQGTAPTTRKPVPTPRARVRIHRLRSIIFPWSQHTFQLLYSIVLPRASGLELHNLRLVGKADPLVPTTRGRHSSVKYQREQTLLRVYRRPMKSIVVGQR